MSKPPGAQRVAKNSARAAPPSKLWQCKDFESQCLWVATRLNEGRTLSDPGIWLGGADPDAVIRKLRKDGLDIETTRVRVVDAADEEHLSIAWRLRSPAMKRTTGA